MIIDLNAEREKRKSSIGKQEEMIKIPIVTKTYTVDDEIKYEVSGDKETPVKWLDD
ncbi:hypothetical protein QUF83_03805 [Bacillus cereus]|uniref:hypothetical protein n=1 Tax=Bacillus cereus TaxID=1396 RepID=UPI0025A0A450|nr:hypothetical protein [Bacillus cereus]MDM5235348.1 hypothetical protein [Bacillus cereus]